LIGKLPVRCRRCRDRFYAFFWVQKKLSPPHKRK
jgi:hypothetical protein